MLSLWLIRSQTHSLFSSCCAFFCSLIQNQMGFTKNNGFNTRLHGVFVCLKPFCTRDQWLLMPRKNNNCCDNNKDDMENNIIITIPNSNWLNGLWVLFVNGVFLNIHLIHTQTHIFTLKSTAFKSTTILLFCYFHVYKLVIHIAGQCQSNTQHFNQTFSFITFM